MNKVEIYRLHFFDPLADGQRTRKARLY